MQGYFEDCRIYNRQLSDAEIQTIYACKGHDGIAYGLAGRWTMIEGYDNQRVTLDATIIKDVSNNKSDGVAKIN